MDDEVEEDETDQDYNPDSDKDDDSDSDDEDGADDAQIENGDHAQVEDGAPEMNDDDVGDATPEADNSDDDDEVGVETPGVDDPEDADEADPVETPGVATEPALTDENDDVETVEDEHEDETLQMRVPLVK